jgi:hypothetical protein
VDHIPLHVPQISSFFFFTNGQVLAKACGKLQELAENE